MTVLSSVSVESDDSHALAQRRNVDRLLRAASDGDEASLLSAAQALDSAASISEVVAAVKDAHGRGALHFAALRDHGELCTRLVTHLHAPVDARDEDGDTPLVLACRAGAAAASLALLRLGADPTLSCAGGAQALHHAAACGDARLVTALLQRGASANAQSELGPPLLWSVSHPHAACVAALLEAGADARARSPDGVPALVAACLHGPEDTQAVACVRALLSAGADVHARAAVLDDATALHVCADCGASELVRDLLNAGADANAKEANGCCALHLAATHGDAATTQILLPVTTPNTRVQPWSVDSVLAAAAAGVFAKASKPCSVQRVANSAASSERPTDAGATIQSEKHSPPSPEAAARAEARKVAGDALFRSGNCAGAAEHYTAALEDDPHNAVLLSNRSVARLRCGDEQGALADAERAQQLRPQWSKAYFRLGTALHALRRFEEAAQALFQGVQLEPDNVEMARAFRQAVEDGREAYKEEQRKAFSAAHTVTR